MDKYSKSWYVCFFLQIFVQCFLEHIQELKYEDKPDYDMLMDVFKASMQRKSVKDTDPYDWEKENSEEESVAVLQQNMKQANLNTNAATSNGILLNNNPTSTNKNIANATMAPGSLMTPFGDMNNLTNNNNNNNANYKDSNLIEQSSEKNKNLTSLNGHNGAETPSQLQQKRAARDQTGESKSIRNQLESGSFKGPIYQQMPVVPNVNNTPNTTNNMNNTNNNQNMNNSNKPKQAPTNNQQVPQAGSNTAAAIAAAAAVQAAANIQAGATSANTSYQMSHQQQAQLNRSGSSLQQQQQLQSSNKLRNLNSRNANREESQASISCGSESNKNSRQFLLGTPQHQPIIKNPKQQQVTSSGLQSYPSATPTTTAGIALMQNGNNKTSNMGNNGNGNGNGGSSQATNSCYTNNYARQVSNGKGFNNLNNSMDYTTPIGKLF